MLAPKHFAAASAFSGFLTVFFLNLLQCATVYSALRPFRAVGYRLVRAAAE